MKRCLCVVLFFLALNSFSYSQTTTTIDSIENENQACLDKGQFMLGCAIRFYGQVDSLLNRVYATLRSELDASKKELLRKEEKEWLKKRDKYFKKTRTSFVKATKENGGVPAQDDEMFMYQENARFVRERVVELLKRLNR